MKKISLLWAFIALAILTPLIIAGYVHYQQDHFTCEDHLTVIDEKTQFELQMRFTFSGGKGRYESYGSYQAAGHAPIAISNQITFSYWREPQKIIMVSDDTNELPKREEPLLKDAPDFFHSRNRGMATELVSVNAQSHLFLSEHVPVMYCMRVNHK